MHLLDRYLPRQDFESYEDFKANYRVNTPDGFNFAYDIVDEWARLDENKPALVWIDDALNEKRFTFGEVKAHSDRVARLLHDSGVRKGDAVMLMGMQRYDVWFAFVALHKIGAIAIPATYQLTPKDIVYRCKAASVKALIVASEDEIIKHVDQALPDCPTVAHRFVIGADRPGYRNLRAEAAAVTAAWVRPTGADAPDTGDPMLIYFSSGTTGMPKMVWHDFTYPLGHIVTAKYWNRVQDGKLHMTMSDSGWAKFAWGKIYGQWICGAVIVAYDTEKFVPQTLLRVIDRLKLTTLCAPPTVFRFLIKEDLSSCDFSTIKHCTIAGEPLNPEVFTQFKKATGLAITEGFGQSETSVLVGNFPWFPVRPGSMGKPSPLYDVDLVGENGKSVEDGVEGCIVVKNADAHPAGLFRGYFRDPEVTARAWKNGVYNTGDMAWRDGEGYYWFIGRNDDVIKCSGYRIGPFEVESAILEHPAVLECAVTAAPDPLRGQVVKATIVLARGFQPSDALVKEIQNHVKRTTAPYKYPRIVEFVAELPKTISGKIRRMEIRSEDEKKG